MNYGRALRLIRSSRDLTQKQVAGRAKVDPSLISLLENGERQPSTETLERLARALEVPLYLLVLLASDEDDLRGITADQAAALGRQLLGLLRPSPRSGGKA